MRDFSLDQNAEKIHSPKTREYFMEVIKSYYNESYRSAIVMLYSISVADLLYKLEELKDLYNDTAAIEILNEIENIQSSSAKLSEWESKLVDLVAKKTSLFDTADHLHFKTLQRLRNLCAHPVMTDNFELYAPNRETTRAHIRNMMEGILTKPALLSKKIFGDFMENLAMVKGIFPDPMQLEKHLRSKYLDRFSIKVKRQIFRSLWKVALKLTDSKSNEHRVITNQALAIMLKNDYSELLNQMMGDKDYFSDIDLINIKNLIHLFNQFPKASEVMNDTIKMMVDNKIEKDADLFTLACYRSISIEDHIEKVLLINHNNDFDDKWISIYSIVEVYDQAVIEAKTAKGNDFSIRMFGRSQGYDMADERYTFLIEPYLQDFTLEELEAVVDAVNKNSQVSGRRRAQNDNYYIRNRITELTNGFNFLNYPNFY